LNSRNVGSKWVGRWSTSEASNICQALPDGTRLALASADRTVRVWHVNNGYEVAKLVRHGGAVRSCAWSPDGTRIASASDDTTVRVWDINSGREVGAYTRPLLGST
jgi:WD40 repeat protein